jgi:hypothetical protein
MSDVLSSAIAFALVSIHSSGTYSTHVPAGASSAVDAYTSPVDPSSHESTSPPHRCIPHSYAQASNDGTSRGAFSSMSTTAGDDEDGAPASRWPPHRTSSPWPSRRARDGDDDDDDDGYPPPHGTNAVATTSSFEAHANAVANRSRVRFVMAGRGGRGRGCE